MLTLFYHPFCPHSRFIRLALAEHGIGQVQLIEERVWERRREFLGLNPACTTPVLVEEGHPPIPGAGTIAEYLDETRGAELGNRRLLPKALSERVEVRRLLSWFNEKFFAEVTGPLTMERLYKRYMGALAQGIDACNGWAFWHLDTPTGLVSIDSLREIVRKDRSPD